MGSLKFSFLTNLRSVALRIHNLSYLLHSELDRQLGDTQCEINGKFTIATELFNFKICLFCHLTVTKLSNYADHETKIMHRLQNLILTHTKVLLDVMEYSAELDW